MRINTLNDLEVLSLRRPRTLIGVGVTAFSRIVPSRFWNGYSILAYRDSLDLEWIRKACPVLAVEEGNEGPSTERVDASAILSDLRVLERLGKERDGEVCLLVYQSYPELEEKARALGWRILASPARIRRAFEDKDRFRDLLEQLGLPRIPGESQPLRFLSDRTYLKAIERYGERLVFQLPDVRQGGGRGTFYIDSIEDFREFQAWMKEGVYRGYRIERVILARRILGIPASVACCQTRWGTLVTPLQVQLMDVPDVLGASKGDGFFCGHDWHLQPFTEIQRRKAVDCAQAIGQALGEAGFRGVFGIDFVAEEGGESLYPVECNPRYTGAFPMISLLHLGKGIVPLDAFHILEFLDEDYEIDLEGLNSQYHTGIEGSHIILFLKSQGRTRVLGGLGPGCFRIDPDTGEGRFLHPGMDYLDLSSPEEFLVVDGVPRVGKVLSGSDGLYRLCRLLFAGSVADTPFSLNPKGRWACQWVYDRLCLMPNVE